MNRLLDPCFFWAPFGVLAISLGPGNLLAATVRKSHWVQVLTYASFSFGLLTVMSVYLMIERWVLKGDYEALESIVPHSIQILMGWVMMLIFLKGFAVIQNRRRP